ncbi:MAG: hypothetical protein AAGF98_13995 [Cyanobacteria bacterium P01_H01_bin.153]
MNCCSTSTDITAQDSVGRALGQATVLSGHQGMAGAGAGAIAHPWKMRLLAGLRRLSLPDLFEV